ncbi:MAG: DUF349 domain-containing protein [Algoriphagus sp.]|nr:DUF349 domain-containing protein [Algoriphagus sp.]MDP4838275.1 DUF349 domain-containing protein [Algoriphagus sp.]
MNKKSKEISEEDKVTQASENVVEGIELTANEIETLKEEEVVNLQQVENQEIQVTDEIAEKPIELEVNIPSESIVDEEVTDSEESAVEEEPVPLDLSGQSKAQLLDLIKEKINSPNALKSDKTIQEIKNAFDVLSNKEREDAMQQFLGEGGIADDFEYKGSSIDKEFNIIFNDFKKQLYANRKEAEKQKEKNLVAKTELLNKLRELVDGEETTLSMAAVKAIQDSWKSIGPVPLSQSRNLWASFNALMDRFYDNRSIYFELKELDRKKNLESKLELCEKAESLVQLEDLKDAIQQLNELHEEFKHLGPVPREEQEQVWQRFKSASDAIYDRRKEFFEGQKDVIKKNLEEKEALIVILTPFGEFKADRIKDWNSKTKEILELQKAWEKVGPLPKESSKEINKAFWTLFKQFFHNKNLFFKELDDIRATNQKKAEELIAKAQELQENTNWQTTANQFVKLQQDWKKLGPTPEKQRDALYKKFKEACDTFFENRRNSSKDSNTEFELNLAKKLAIIDQINALKSVETGLDENQLSDLVAEFNALGFVPRKNIKEVQAKFKEAVDVCLDALGEKGANKEDFLFRLNLNRIQSDPNSVKTLNKKEHGIRKQITDLENSITLWRNNLDFFAASKTADKLREQFDVKIQKAEEEIDKLKKKLTILKEF